MKDVFLLESKRIFNLKNTVVFLLFFLLALYFVYFGAAKYKDFLAEKENFLNYERLRISRYVNYEQYGSFGFRVLLQPSPLIVFCHSALQTLESNIDIKGTIDINSIYKGQTVFIANGMKGDFYALFFVFGSLMMLYFGLNTFASIEYLRFHTLKNYIPNTLCCRFFILTGFFFSVILTSYLFAKTLGIPFTRVDTAAFLTHSLYVMLFITFFHILGIAAGAILKFKKVFFISAYLVWFLMVFVIPIICNMTLEKKAKGIQSNETVNIEKFHHTKKFEIKGEEYFKRLEEKKVKEIRPLVKKFVEEYIRNILPLNKAIENRLNNQVKNLVTHHEKKSLLFPTLFYPFLSKELTGMGYYGYQDFLAHVMELKDNFFSYYFEKRYNQIDQSVEPFIKNNENIFHSRSCLPANYWKGIRMMVIYCLLLLGGTLFLLRRSRKPPKAPEPIKLNTLELEMGKTYFYHYKDPKQKNGIIHYLESKNAVIIAKPNPCLHDPGTSLNTWLRFERSQQKSNPHFDDRQVKENLETLGITRQHLEQKIKKLDKEVFYSAYLALKLAQNTAIYVFDDFLYRVSKEFEQAFKYTINKMKPHAIIIYLGSQLFDITVKDRDQNQPDDLRLVAIDLDAVSLR